MLRKLILNTLGQTQGLDFKSGEISDESPLECTRYKLLKSKIVKIFGAQPQMSRCFPLLARLYLLQLNNLLLATMFTCTLCLPMSSPI